MRIKGKCLHCGRELLVQQLEDSGGHCPWCGKAFSGDYTANLTKALQEAEAAGTRLQGALEDLSSMEPALELDEDSVLEEIRQALRSTRRRARLPR